MEAKRLVLCLRASRGAAAGLLLAAAAAMTIARPAAAQVHEIKLAGFLPPQHVMMKWLETSAAELEKQSVGRLKFTLLFGAQMGPVPRYYDIARTGQADMSFFMHGATPGRFPLNEITNLPFLFCNAEHAMRVMNEPELRAKYLDPEHGGTRVLMMFAHPPGQLHVGSKHVRGLDDLKGMAIRPPSKSTSELVHALGAQSIGIPTTDIADALQKATLGAALTDYGAAGLAFRLGPLVKYVVEMYAYTTSMALVMHPDSFAKLPPDLQSLVEGHFKTRVVDAAQAWDALDQVGKRAMIDAGAQIVHLTAADKAKLKQIGKAVADRWVTSIDKAGAQGSATHKLMHSLIAKHAAPAGCKP